MGLGVGGYEDLEGSQTFCLVTIRGAIENTFEARDLEMGGGGHQETTAYVDQKTKETVLIFVHF